jgi:glycosyltransferase involved in cell wall biosynthesis
MTRPLYTDAREIGGAERSLAHLAAALSREIEVAVVGVDEKVVDEVAAGRRDATSAVLPFVRTRYDASAIAAHLRMLLDLRPHVFHANLISPWACQMAIFLAGSVPRVRVVAVEQLPSPPRSAWQLRLKRVTARRLSAHVAVGERSAREVERLLGLRRGSVRTIYNGVPDFEPGNTGLALHSGPTIGAVGRIEHQKGFDVLIRALPGLPQAQVVFVGDGAERGDLARLAAEAGVAERVHWVGWSEEPHAYLASFDVFALPSRFEGFPLAVVEAMLARLPVVASDVGSVAEAVRHGETGLLVPAEDPGALAAALGSLLENPRRRSELGERARALALDRFTAGAMARSFESLYEEICS